MSFWPIASERAVQDADHREHQDHRGGPARGLGEQLEAEPDHPEGADLVEHADQQHRGAGRCASSAASGSQVCTGHHRRLDREGDEEADEQPAAGVGGDRDLAQLGEQVRRAAGRRPTRRTGRSPRPASAARRPGRRSGTSPRRSERRRPAEAADQEVDRDQRGLEEARRTGTRRSRRTRRSRGPRGPASRRRTP